jgi:multicomponent K+:H+ antiporter subunit C
MEFLMASGIGLLTSVGVYLLLRPTSFSVVMGAVFLSYAVNLLLFSTGRLKIASAPILSPDGADYADPLPQALVLTAIVISFAMTALVITMALRGYLETGSDRVDANVEPGRGDEADQSGADRR